MIGAAVSRRGPDHRLVALERTIPRRDLATLMKASEHAAQIWPVLALAARNHQVVSCGLLSRLISVPAAGLGQLLEPIQSYFLLNDLPPLRAIVVSKDSGLPGTGFIAARDLSREQLRVFGPDWIEAGCPTPDSLADAALHRPSNGVAASISQPGVVWFPYA